jgi:hypothetical protein
MQDYYIVINRDPAYLSHLKKFWGEVLIITMNRLRVCLKIQRFCIMELINNRS